MSRRRVVLAFLILVPVGCGRRGRLRLPEAEGGAADRKPAPTPPAPASRRPAPAGLETG